MDPSYKTDVDKISGAMASRLDAINKAAAPILHKNTLPVRKPNPPSPVPLLAPVTRPSNLAPATQPKGFGNGGNNCWANSLLSMIVDIPSLRHIYQTVAEHYLEKNSIEDRNCGIRLINALTAYDNALLLNKSVPPNISQGVRLAFQHIAAPIHKNDYEGFSQTDAIDPLRLITGHYERILREANIPLPKNIFHSLLETQHCQLFPYPSTDSFKISHSGNYSELSPDNTISGRTQGYELVMDINPSRSTLPQMLDHYFNEPIDNDNPDGLRADGTGLVQGTPYEYQWNRKTRHFEIIPQEFILTLKRFRQDDYGQQSKIRSAIIVPQVIALPENAIPPGNHPPIYELDAFVEHTGGTNGGHYICYKKLGKQWFLVDDSRVTPRSDTQINLALKESYFHHYRHAPEPVEESPAPQLAPTAPTPQPTPDSSSATNTEPLSSPTPAAAAATPPVKQEGWTAKLCSWLSGIWAFFTSCFRSTPKAGKKTH